MPHQNSGPLSHKDKTQTSENFIFKRSNQEAKMLCNCCALSLILPWLACPFFPQGVKYFQLEVENIISDTHNTYFNVPEHQVL